MNERIKNFLVVCGMPNEQICEILEDHKQTRYIQNFAELIIKECANACLKATNEDSPVHLVSIAYADNVKKHFGIDE